MRSTVILSGIAAIVSAAPAAPSGKASPGSKAVVPAPGFVPHGQDWYVNLHILVNTDALANQIALQAPPSLGALKLLGVHLNSPLDLRDDRVHVDAS